MLISFQGVLTDADDKIFNSQSRIYKYGDGFFESIKVIGKKPQLFKESKEHPIFSTFR
jgi:hypothetical protein